jgi:hypothetical protein
MMGNFRMSEFSLLRYEESYVKNLGADGARTRNPRRDRAVL